MKKGARRRQDSAKKCNRIKNAPHNARVAQDRYRILFERSSGSTVVDLQMLDKLIPVIQHGQLNQAELGDLARSCTVCVLPSFYEGLVAVDHGEWVLQPSEKMVLGVVGTGMCDLDFPVLQFPKIAKQPPRGPDGLFRCRGLTGVAEQLSEVLPVRAGKALQDLGQRRFPFAQQSVPQRLQLVETPGGLACLLLPLVHGRADRVGIHFPHQPAQVLELAATGASTPDRPRLQDRLAKRRRQR